jgi:hypothetical protein
LNYEPIARRGPWNDCANLPTVAEATSVQTRIGLVLANAEFDSERNHTYIRQQLGAQSVIPARRGKKNVESSRSARRDAASGSIGTGPDRNAVLFGEAQTLGPCAGALAAHPEASSAAARTEFQSESPETSLPFLEDVNEPDNL